MTRLATCPTCRQQMEFFGIGHYPMKGRKSKLTARWTMCTRCGTSQAEDFNGRILKVRTDKWTRKEIEDTFPTTREKNERNKKRNSTGEPQAS
jgi:hypothetical protein